MIALDPGPKNCTTLFLKHFFSRFIVITQLHFSKGSNFSDLTHKDSACSQTKQAEKKHHSNIPWHVQFKVKRV